MSDATREASTSRKTFGEGTFIGNGTTGGAHSLRSAPFGCGLSSADERSNR